MVVLAKCIPGLIYTLGISITGVIIVTPSDFNVSVHSVFVVVVHVHMDWQWRTRPDIDVSGHSPWETTHFADPSSLVLGRVDISAALDLPG